MMMVLMIGVMTGRGGSYYVLLTVVIDYNNDKMVVRWW
jgi:hypothetical protein